MSRERAFFHPALLFLLPSLLGFMLFYILPFVLSLGYAFSAPGINQSFVGFENFLQLLQNKAYLKGLSNTLFFIATAVPMSILVSLAAALMIKTISKEFFVLIFLIPLVIPSGSVVFFWQTLFGAKGYINFLLTQMGFSAVNWLETNNARLVVISIFLWKNMGFNMVLFLSALTSIPKEYYEAAQIDGTGSFREFWFITLPNLPPTLIVVLIMSIINSFKIFKEIYLLTGSYPHDSVYTLQHFMNNMFNSLDYQKLTTATIMLVFIITAVTQTLLRLENRR